MRDRNIPRSPKISANGVRVANKVKRHRPSRCGATSAHFSDQRPDCRRRGKQVFFNLATDPKTCAVFSRTVEKTGVRWAGEAGVTAKCKVSAKNFKCIPGSSEMSNLIRSAPGES